jgi:3-oxoadipate enol-lactonase
MRKRASRRLIVSLGVALVVTATSIASAQTPAATVSSGGASSGTTASGLFYEQSGSGPALVFVHAFSVDRRMWEPQVMAFEGRFRVIRYDLRGHGRSAAPGAPYAAYEDLREVLDAVHVERATLVGLSAGSEVALNFALAYPGRVERLALASPGLGGYTVPPLPWATAVFQAAGRGDAAAAASLWADTPIMAVLRNASGGQRIKAIVAENARLWTYQRNERPLSPAAIGRLRDITVPVLVVTGDADLPHILDIASVITGGVAGSRRVTIPGVGHMLNVDDAPAFNDALSAFLRR